MVREVYGVHLSGQEKGLLKKMIRTGRSSARAVTNSHRPIADRGRGSSCHCGRRPGLRRMEGSQEVEEPTEKVE